MDSEIRSESVLRQGGNQRTVAQVPCAPIIARTVVSLDHWVSLPDNGAIGERRDARAVTAALSRRKPLGRSDRFRARTSQASEAGV